MREYNNLHKKQNNKISIEFVKHRLNQAKENIEEAEILYKANKFKGANNRAYYSIFHSMRAVLGLDGRDFKKHKDVLGYFNKNYVNKEIFPKNFGHKIALSSKIREDSDYGDEFKPSEIDTSMQISTAKELYEKVETYVYQKIKEINITKEQNIDKNDEEIIDVEISTYNLGKKKNILDYIIDKDKNFTIKDIFDYSSEGIKLIDKYDSVGEIRIK